MNPLPKKIFVEKAVHECRAIATSHIQKWKPVNPDWPTIDGAAYLRLSTVEQVLVDKGSLEQQIHLAIAEVEARSRQKKVNYRIVRFYIDAGVSGRDANRKEFLLLKKDIRHRCYSFVAVKEISRIARDIVIWKEFFKLCQENNCEIVIRSLPIDPNDPSSILQLDILAVFGEYEAKVCSRRIRHSVFSAMVNNGKFNATHKVLGFDPVTVNGELKSGFYTPNLEELKLVEWIMRTFLKYGSHTKTLEECSKKAVVNKNGKPFLRHSLISLLTNTRYIGKWYLNIENKDKAQESLNSDDCYHEINLPHGPVVDLDLWQQVQKKLAILADSSGKHKNGQNRVYPLSGGLLQFLDKTAFKGNKGNGNTTSSFYYKNSANKINIRADLLEPDSAKVVAALVKKDPLIRDAIKKYGQDIADYGSVLEDQLKKIVSEITINQDQKQTYMRALSKLLTDCESPDEIKTIKEGFMSHLQEAENRQRTLEVQVEEIKRNLAASKDSRFSWDKVGEQAERILSIMAEHDPEALKQAYHSLFSRVVVGPEDENGVRTVEYVLSDHAEDDFGLRSEMVEVPTF